MHQHTQPLQWRPRAVGENVAQQAGVRPPLIAPQPEQDRRLVRTRDNLAAGDLDDLVEIREGDALKTLRADLPDTIDLVLLDGAKALYPDILDLVENRLKPGAFVVADNADYSPDYLARVRSPESGYVSVPFGGDVELSMWLG